MTNVVVERNIKETVPFIASNESNELGQSNTKINKQNLGGRSVSVASIDNLKNVIDKGNKIDIGNDVDIGIGPTGIKSNESIEGRKHNGVMDGKLDQLYGAGSRDTADDVVYEQDSDELYNDETDNQDVNGVTVSTPQN